MKVLRAFKFRLKVDEEQQSAFWNQSGAYSTVLQQTLKDLDKAYKDASKNPSYRGIVLLFHHFFHIHAMQEWMFSPFILVG
ncbi:TPA: helix-turn-helix domain-containing protein [Vibrio cholerae]|nr:helix-turn-helix domain-containing protein [Vibrio cholerae]